YIAKASDADRFSEAPAAPPPTAATAQRTFQPTGFAAGYGAVPLPKNPLRAGCRDWPRSSPNAQRGRVRGIARGDTAATVQAHLPGWKGWESRQSQRGPALCEASQERLGTAAPGVP